MNTAKPESSGPSGVSILLCTKNGAERLPETLAHLAAQEVPDGMPWEVILVDNGSTDGTAELARKLWPLHAGAPLRVLVEPRPGKSNAIETGWKSARQPVILIVDDDNWLAPRYVAATGAIFAESPGAAITSGYAAAEFAVEPPEWFVRFQATYAVANEGWPSGDVTEELPIPSGAGMGIRKAAVDELYERGFQYLLRGRVLDLMGCEDAELCLALRLAGWRWWRDQGLRLRHFMPAERLRWSYCRRLARGLGAGYARLDVYALARLPPPSGPLAEMKETWPWLLLRALKPIACNPRLMARCLFTEAEGCADVFWMETRLGRWLGLLRFRKQVRRSIASVRSASWAWKGSEDRTSGLRSNRAV